MKQIFKIVYFKFLFLHFKNFCPFILLGIFHRFLVGKSASLLKSRINPSC